MKFYMFSQYQLSFKRLLDYMAAPAVAFVVSAPPADEGEDSSPLGGRQAVVRGLAVGSGRTGRAKRPCPG